MNAPKKIYIDNVFLNKIRSIHRILAIMDYYNACDVIFLPMTDGVKVKVKTKDNVVLSQDLMAYSMYNTILTSLQLGTNLDPTSTDPQNSSIRFCVDNKFYNCRLAFHPSRFATSLCLRVIRPELFDPAIFNLNQDKIKKILSGGGLVLIGGRTCSGKTTLLYTLITNYHAHVVTMEDPIESELSNIVQTDIRTMGYVDGARSVLRQNPDLIVIGEIRDKSAGQCAVRCAYTGHQVLSTIHVTSPNLIFNRLIELGCEYFNETLSCLIFMDHFKPKFFRVSDGNIIEVDI